MFRTARFFAFALLLAAIPDGLRAQAPPAGTTPAFVLESDNGDNRIQFGGLLQIDGRFAADGGDRPGASTFFVRRLRAVTQGRLARHVEFYVNVDFAGNATHVRDAYFDTRLADAIRIRVGKFKAPFSYDRLVPAAHLLFVERSFTTAIAADRDVGLQLLGDLPGGRVSYGLALTNGAPDGGTGDTDADSSKDVTARLVVRPVAASSSRPWSGLRVALALNSGQSTTQLPSFQTTARQPFFAYQGATGDGRRTRWSPQVIYVSGPLWAYGEYVHSRGGVRRDDDVATVDHEAWVVGGSWVLTGEAAPERDARPEVPFDPSTSHWGAVQLTARVHALHVSRQALAFADPSSTPDARAITFGVNWYLNPFLKWNLNFGRTIFGNAANRPRPAEHVLLLRGQLGF